MFTPPTDFAPFLTDDGSWTMRSACLQEPYHSTHGAVQESTYVYIQQGLQATGLQHVDVLEVGLGTGLNFLLTWVRCAEGKCTVHYTALEPFPLAAADLERLAHCEDLAWPGLHEPFMARMTGTPGIWHPEECGITFMRSEQKVEDLQASEAFDLVYFDPFGPRVQPELWSAEVFGRLYTAMRPGAILVTYCAKGIVRRTLATVGFRVERLKGPPGKAHMLRAIK